MTMTLKDVRDDIVLRAGCAGNRLWTHERLNHVINRSLISAQLTCLNAGVTGRWEVSTELSAGLSIAYFGKTAAKKIPLSEIYFPDILSEFIAPIFLLYCGYGSEINEAAFCKPSLFLQKASNLFEKPTLRQPIYTRVKNELYLLPLSISEGTAFYYKRIAMAANDDDEIDLPEEYAEAFIKNCVQSIQEQKESV